MNTKQNEPIPSVFIEHFKLSSTVEIEKIGIHKITLFCISFQS